MCDRVVHAIHPSWGNVALAAVLVGIGFPAARSNGEAELVHADGRREMVQEARRDSQGRWTAVRDGRVTMVTPGEVVVVVDASGKEIELIPPLLETPDSPETAALLASLRDPKNEGWLVQTAAELAKHPTRGIHDALIQLTADRKKETRIRAIGALARLRTKESVTAATAAVLAEKDPGTRRASASALFSVEEIFKRCEAAQSVAAGIADKDAGVRYVFAMLSPARSPRSAVRSHRRRRTRRATADRGAGRDLQGPGEARDGAREGRAHESDVVEDRGGPKGGGSGARDVRGEVAARPPARDEPDDRRSTAFQVPFHPLRSGAARRTTQPLDNS